VSKENLQIEDLLVKQMLGEATDAEMAEVEEWLKESEANRRHYAQFQKIWADSKKLAVNSTVNENEAWERFQHRTRSAEISTPRTIELAPCKTNWMRVAAILVVLLGAGWMITQTMMNKEQVYASADATMVQELPDGTVVTLNKNSTLAYSDAGKTREVKLTGEAFFDVTPNKNKPFIITADDARIKVVGTSFNVKSSAAKTEVIVETGIVEVSKKQNTVKLLPKEKATVLQSDAVPLKEKVADVLYNYYRTKELVCDNTPLWRLVDVLNDAYNANIVIADARLKDMPITTTFKNESLDNILAVVSGTLHIKVEKNGKDIILR
jgi:transmembrane sensor